MKRYLRWIGAIIGTPLILFFLLCILIYLPPIQNFAVRTATQMASEATGMQISIGRISLSFPLDLVVHRTLVVDRQDTLLQAEKLTASVQLLPLLKKKVELDGLELNHASVNTAKLIEGMTLKGELGKAFIASHGVDLNPETAVVNRFLLEDTHIAMCMADTTAADTTASAPVYWKIDLKDISLKNVSFAMEMPLDSMDFSIALKAASLRNGMIDLRESAYAIQHFNLEGSRITYNSGNDSVRLQGLDPSHIALTDLNLSLDSIYYANEDIHAQIRNFILKERSGLEITSAQGRLVSDSKALQIPSLQIKTADSYLEIGASMDWEAAHAEKDGGIRARLLADIGKNDLLKALGEDASSFLTTYPNQPLQLRAGVDGSLNHLRLSALSASMPQAFSLKAEGQMDYPIDSLRRTGHINLALETQNMSFLEKMLDGIGIPSGLKLNGNAKVEGPQLNAEMQLQTAQNQGKVGLLAAYNLPQEEYKVQLNIDSLNMNLFLPKDSLYQITAEVAASGIGTDFFSSATAAQLNGQLKQLVYGSQTVSGIGLEASLAQHQVRANLGVQNAWADVNINLSGTLTSKSIQANLTTALKRLDLQAMKWTNYYLSPSLTLESKLTTDLKENHKLYADIRDITLHTETTHYKTKDIHLGGELTPDSLRSFINSGDLVFWFKSMNSLDKLTQDLTRLTTRAVKQWEQKHIDQQQIKAMLPNTELGIRAGNNNPLANMMAANHIKFNKLDVNFRTNPEEGLKGKANLYGLRTDSLMLDTIYFQVAQDTTRFNFIGGVKALSNRWQEGFDVSLQGDFTTTEGGLNIAYLNEKGEQGVDLGMKVFLQKEGISLHISPDNPTLVYRPFQANPDNYIYLSDQGRIHAKLNLYDENHSGLAFYSNPDSLAQQDLTLALNRIDIEEFQRIIPYMPDIAGFISAEAHYIQNEKNMQVAAEVNVDQLAYNKSPLGNFGMSMVYLPQETGSHHVDGFLTLNDKEVINLTGTYAAAPNSKLKDKIEADIQVTDFPLNLANAFIPDKMALLTGNLEGNVGISGSSDAPILNGNLKLDSTSVSVPQASLYLTLDNQPLKIKDSKLVFKRFKIFTRGESPFLINGEVDLADMGIDLQMNARNFEVLNSKKNKEALVYGKLYVDLSSTIKGTPDDLKMRGNMNILGSSNFTYILKDSPLTVEDRLNETVTFVNFSDTLATGFGNMPAMSLGGMDMLMTLHIDEAVQARVDLNLDGSNYMLLEGGGDLSFQYQADGNMVLNGRYSLTNGEMKYQLPIIPLKTFRIQEGSYIEWTGNMMNPNLNIKATERIRSSVTTEDGGSRNVNFDVGVSITNRLENLGFIFTLDAPNDGSMQNELASKSAEEKNKLAVTMLVTGIYMGDGNNLGGKSNANNTLNNYLQGQINKMAGKVAGSALKTIDINLGIETNEQENGTSSTDYNFQFAKRFWNNRFQVVIGGRISTGNDVQQDESFIDNVSLEYRLDKSGTRYIKIFHDKNYESILDGEVIETGAGVVLRKKVSRLGELFIFRNSKKKRPQPTDKKPTDKKNKKDKSDKNEKTDTDENN